MKFGIVIAILFVGIVATYYFSRNLPKRFSFADFGLSHNLTSDIQPDSAKNPTLDSYPTIVYNNLQGIKQKSYDSLRKKNVMYVGELLQQYYAQHRSAPNALQTLIDVGQAKSIPIDPETKKALNYQIINNQSEVCEVFTYLSTGERFGAFCINH